MHVNSSRRDASQFARPPRHAGSRRRAVAAARAVRAPGARRCTAAGRHGRRPRPGREPGTACAALLPPGHGAHVGVQSGRVAARVRGGRGGRSALRAVLVGRRVGGGAAHQRRHDGRTKPHVRTRRSASAIALAPTASPRTRGLIEALAKRHPARGEVDEGAYAQRPARPGQRYPRDADIALLAAEALLNLHPYDWWEADGSPKPRHAGDRAAPGRGAESSRPPPGRACTTGST